MSTFVSTERRDAVAVVTIDNPPLNALSAALLEELEAELEALGADAAVRAIVLRGEPTLRTHEGEQQLRQGDVVAFPRGKEGAHQIRNDTDAPVRVLMLSTLIAPDIVEYLDTGKISARSVAGERIIFARPGPELEYWEDED